MYLPPSSFNKWIVVVSALNHQGTSADKSQHANIDLLESLYQRKSYITSLSGFLAESDPYKALGYWLSNFENLTANTKIDDIGFIINRAIARIDHLINDQVNELIHHPKLQKLEASWRGLWYLVVQADGSRNIKIRYLDITWAEITKDIER